MTDMTIMNDQAFDNIKQDRFFSHTELGNQSEINIIMKNLVPAADNNKISRWFLIPYLVSLLHLSQATAYQNPQFTLPRFDPFRPITSQSFKITDRIKNDNKRKTYRLLLALIIAHKSEIIIGLMTGLLWVLSNSLTPKIMKEFFRLMKVTNLKAEQIENANYLTQKFIGLQLLRIIASANTRRLFNELSVKVNGALAIKMVEKALNLSHSCRQMLPEAEIYQLENTDMKAVNKMFRQLWVLTNIPFTIFAATGLLFTEGASFGIVGIYWIFLLIFLHRWLYDLMSESVTRKLRITELRSRTNYELVEKMVEARLDLSEDYIIESNNNYFLAQLKQFHLFHRLQTIFDISLIIMPLIFVISMTFYDINEATSFTIQEIYLLLTLIGLMSKPLKNLKKFSLTLAEGMYSLNRFALYLDLPEQNNPRVQFLNRQNAAPKIVVRKNTLCLNRVSWQTMFKCMIPMDIRAYFGERLVFLGRREKQASHFIRAIMGEIQTISGHILIEGSLAYLPKQNCFSTQSINRNIAFFDLLMEESTIKQYYQKLGLSEDFEMREGLGEKMQTKQFTQTQLKKIGLARAICSHRKVLILDCPFEGLTSSASEKLEQILRQRQEEGSLIIISSTSLQYSRGDDKIAIISNGAIKEFGQQYKLHSFKDSMIHSLQKGRRLLLSDSITCYNILVAFQRKLTQIVNEGHITESQAKEQYNQKHKQLEAIFRAVGKYSHKLKKVADHRMSMKKKEEKKSFLVYAWHVFRYLPLGDWMCSALTILVIELLNIFIQYQFGNEYKHGGKSKLSTLRGIMKFELALTVCLAGMIYLHKEIEFSMSNIIGNKIYKNSLKGLTKKPMSWYVKNSPHLIANKYNHDYDEIFTCVRFVLDIARYTIVLITTILLIDATTEVVIVLTIITSTCYYYLLKIFRNAEETLIRAYPIYKNEFIKVFDEVVEGAHMIKVFNKESEAINKAKVGFVHVAAYKLTSQACQVSQEVVCELVGTFIIALGLELGTKAKLLKGNQNEAMIAISVMLLLNLSDVLKTIMKTFLKLETFFRLKMLTFIEMIDIKEKKDQNLAKVPLRYKLQFKQRLIQNPDDPLFQLYPLTLTVEQNQRVLLLEKDSVVRKNFINILTNNFLDSVDQNKRNYVNVVAIGGQLIKHIMKRDLRYLVGTILSNNFYFSGTLRQNLEWKARPLNQTEMLRLTEAINLARQIPDFDKYGVDVWIDGQKKNRQLSRKIALLKIILRRPKIVVIKDTSWTVGGLNIADLFREEHVFSSIIGISQSPLGVKKAERVLLMERAKILEEGSTEQLQADMLSQSGEMLRLHKEEPSDQEFSEINAKEKENSMREDLIKTIIDMNVLKDESD